MVNHVGLCVTDLERSRRFYEELLGFEFERAMRVPDHPSARLLRVSPPVGLSVVYLRHGEFTLELLAYEREGNPPFRERVMNEPGLTHLSVDVPDLPAVLERVASLGGTVLDDTNLGGRVAFIRDPDGQLIEVLPEGWRQAQG